MDACRTERVTTQACRVQWSSLAGLEPEPDGRARACPPNGPQLASLKPGPDGRVRASFWVVPGLFT
jgi:hypothetical protein